MSKHDLSSLTKVYTGGAPTPPGVLDDWYQRTGTRIQPMYGLTEATSPTHMTPHGVVPPVDARTGAVSVGVPVFDTDVRIVTDVGLDAAPREIGELVIAGPQIIPGYWQKPKETAESLRDGELRTGDVGFMDEQGWFYLVDRAKDMIVASGFKVWPREVEEVLYLHPAVREAAVIGIADPYRGETIKAVISLKAGHHATVERDQGVRARADGRLQVPARGRDRRRSAQDDQRQDHAPAAADHRRRRSSRCRARSSSSPACRIRSCGPRSRRGRCSRSVPCGCGSAAARSRAPPRKRSTSGCAPCSAQLDDSGQIHRPRRLLRGQRGVSRRRDRPGRERAPVPRVPPPAAARTAVGGAEGHARARPTT